MMFASLGIDALPERLRAAIELSNITIAEAARRCEMPQPSIEGYLAGKNMPGARAIAAICVGLKISADWLLFGTGHARRGWQ
ncbi:helix-turn-helix domain-containing protein [Rhodobacter capsulatus]|uniref:helix-turn-helix domain-containing protein n=1 Tax=Rhodobacter capsulatus TaxID=1061 RepID=UPI000418335A|nr:helix-turn-helix transcriptional regulator [Rhodobacter capsulatus]